MIFAQNFVVDIFVDKKLATKLGDDFTVSLYFSASNNM